MAVLKLLRAHFRKSAAVKARSDRDSAISQIGTFTYRSRTGIAAINVKGKRDITCMNAPSGVRRPANPIMIIVSGKAGSVLRKLNAVIESR